MPEGVTLLSDGPHNAAPVRSPSNARRNAASSLPPSFFMISKGLSECSNTGQPRDDSVNFLATTCNSGEISTTRFGLSERRTRAAANGRTASQAFFCKTGLLHGTFQQMHQKQAAPLEFTHIGLMRLPFPRDMKRLEQLRSLTIWPQSLGIEERAILVRRKGTQEQRVDVNRAITSGPFQALKAASKVIQ
jgi:hypothetical protein